MPADREAVARQIRDACLDRGFFCIVGHDVEPLLIEAALAQTRALFNLPLERKLAMDKSNAGGKRGYEPLRGQRLEAGAPEDLKEGFYIGSDAQAGEGGAFTHWPNQWPVDLPAFAPAMQAYYAAMLDLSRLLMRGLALSLDLTEDAFDAFCADPIAILRLLHYPAQFGPDPKGAKGAGAHTDFGALTLLLQDDVAGLEVFDQAAGGWTLAPPMPGAYVVNLGDLIARWTNDRYRSTLHRVVGTPGADRYSIPFFLSGAPAHQVICLPGCLPDGQSPIYPPTTVEEHLTERYRQTYEV